MLGPLCASTTHCTVCPFSSLTSNLKKQCGLAQNHSTTVPLRVSFFEVSNDAAPWCANNGVLSARRHTAAATCQKCRYFMAYLHTRIIREQWPDLTTCKLKPDPKTRGVHNT